MRGQESSVSSSKRQTAPLFAESSSPKYRTRNPLKRAAIRRFFKTLIRLCAPTLAQGGQRVLEVGAGDCFPTLVLRGAFPQNSFTALDLNASPIRHARASHPELAVLLADLRTLPFSATSFDLLLCCEVLEHLSDPDSALVELKRVAAYQALLTVPHEPFFRLGNLACGNNIRRWGHDPEHVQHFSPRSFRALVERHFTVEKAQLSFPWILLLASRQ